MKINRLKLITLVNDEIARRGRAARDEHATRLGKVLEDISLYKAATHDAWLQFAKKIVDRVSAGEVIQHKDVPVELRFSSSYRVELMLIDGNEKPRMRTPDIGALTRLRELLEASDDAEVSTYGIEKEGFSIGRVLRGN